MRAAQAMLIGAMLAGFAAQAQDEPAEPEPDVAIEAPAEAGVPAEAEPAAAPAPAVDPALNPLAATDVSRYAAFRDKPLFTPSRRRPEPPPEPEPEPVAEAPPAPPKQDEPAPDLKLTGVIEGPDGAIAVLVNGDGGTVERLRLGDQLSGWLVTSILPTEVRLTLGEREQDYRLFARDRAAAAPTPEAIEQE